MPDMAIVMALCVTCIVTCITIMPALYYFIHMVMSKYSFFFFPFVRGFFKKGTCKRRMQDCLQLDQIHSNMQGNLCPLSGQLVLHSQNEPYSDV